MEHKLILITSGEPAGIGPDIVLDVAYMSLPAKYQVIVLGSIELLKNRAQLLHKNITFVRVGAEDLASHGAKLYDRVLNLSNYLLVYDLPCEEVDTLGVLNIVNVGYVLNQLDTAINLCKQGIANIIVTCPLSKEIINEAGVLFTGHTEYLAQKFNCKKVVMMLANDKMKVALVTTHVPLRQVADLITPDNLNQTIKIIIEAFIHFGINNPKIAVCGLNPHAGEGGYLGTEEINIINPVIANWAKLGYKVSGSYPADTIFNSVHEYDIILAMYHDQGLPVLKYSDFNTGVNVTLGLPIIRTSVDHGTALDLVGKNIASSASLISAIKFAIKYY